MIPAQSAQKIADGMTLAAQGCMEVAKWAQEQAITHSYGERGACADQRLIPVDEDVADGSHVDAQEEWVPDAQIPVEDPVVTLEQVRGLFSRLSLEGHTKEIRDLILATGVKKLSDVPAEKYVELMEAALEVSDA